MEDNQVEEVDTEGVAEATEEIKDAQAVLKALEKAKAEAKKRREDYDALQKEYNELKSNNPVDKFKDRAKRAEVKLALTDKGLKNVDGILKHLSLDGIDYDSDGELIGLDSTLATLKEDIPALFSAKARAGSVEQFAEGVAKKPLTASEIQAAQFLNKKW